MMKRSVLSHSVESHVPEEDDTRKVEIQSCVHRMPVSPHFQAMARADWDCSHPTKSWLSRTIALRRYLFCRVIENILLKLLNCTESFMRRPPMNIHQLLNQSIRGLSDRGSNGIDNLVVPRQC